MRDCLKQYERGAELWGGDVESPTTLNGNRKSGTLFGEDEVRSELVTAHINGSSFSFPITYY